jgi:hypothetical protein
MHRAVAEAGQRPCKKLAATRISCARSPGADRNRPRRPARPCAAADGLCRRAAVRHDRAVPDPCPRSWLDVTGITAGAVFQRIRTSPRGRDCRNTPLPRVGSLASSRRSSRPASMPSCWAVTPLGVARSAPAWTATFARPGSSNSAATRATRCSTPTSFGEEQATIVPVINVIGV